MIAAAVQWRLETHDRLTSTSDACRQAALAGAPEGLAIRATQQTAGRGTNGRSWASPPGNLYLSLLLRPSIPPSPSPSAPLPLQVHCEYIDDESPTNHCPPSRAAPWRFTICYDKLVVAAGATASTFGIAGVRDHAFFLREVRDAQAIRRRLLLNLMKSDTPGG